MWEFIHNSNIPFQSIAPITIHPVEPWLLPEPQVIFDLAEFPKESTPPHVYKDKFQQIRSEYQDYSIIYTDGSKKGSRTSAAAVLPYDMFLQERLRDNSSIYSGEGVSIIKSLKWMKASWLKKSLSVQTRYLFLRVLLILTQTMSTLKKYRCYYLNC